ncbi:SH3 domain-containing protein [Bacillus sp. H-16]|uniref:SH3 domain-containing protein n=1 Tax=Alteribacter salitolerans TaxID=2912333 RepID=UPI001963AA28|nr:SH3 domain-containing protein [Alteribacter salitolerans]MBM7096834.1 SH3 domain-containing protein [Alteribacter salitolerans]
MKKNLTIFALVFMIMMPFIMFDSEQPTLANSHDVMTGEVTASSLFVRSQPSTNSNVIGSLSRGTKVSLYERSGSWYKVKVNNQTGYIHGDFVKVTSQPGTALSGQKGQITASSLNVRSSASASSAVIGSLSRGVSVELQERHGSWFKINHNNRSGFIHSDYVKVTSSGSGSATPENQGEVTASNLNVRSQASSSSSIIGSLSRGTKVDLYEKSGSWYKVNVNNRWGFIHADYVKIQGSGSSGNTKPEQQGEITASSLNVRSQASTSGSIIGSLSRGTKVDLYEKSGSWYKVSINNRWGFIHADYVKVQGSGSSDSTKPEQQGEITASSLNVRSQASTSGSIIGSLSRGTKVDLYEKSGSWYKININNRWGFIHADYVKVNGSGGDESIDKKGQITASNLNVRSQASSSASIIGSLRNGTVVDLKGLSGSWYQISYSNQKGFIHSDYVQIVTPGTTPPPSSGQLNGKTIFLDPGHGGNDPGAVVGGDKESALALQISNKLKTELEKLGATVITSRTNDRYVALSERVRMANNTSSDIFLSIHLNAFPDPSAHGTEAFYNTVHAPAGSQKLASSIHNRLVGELGLRDRNVKNANFEVIRYTTMPSTLVEIGFMTNQRDLHIIKNEQDKVVNSLKNGIVDYFN